MAAAGQLRADFLGDDLRRTARKSEEVDQTRQLLALAVILDGGSRREAARTGGGGHGPARRTISGPKGPVSSRPSALPRAPGGACPGATLTPWLSLSSSSVNRSRPGHTPS